MWLDWLEVSTYNASGFQSIMVGFKYDKNTILNSKSELPSEVRNHAYCKMTLVGLVGEEILYYITLWQTGRWKEEQEQMFFSPEAHKCQMDLKLRFFTSPQQMMPCLDPLSGNLVFFAHYSNINMFKMFSNCMLIS